MPLYVTANRGTSKKHMHFRNSQSQTQVETCTENQGGAEQGRAGTGPYLSLVAGICASRGVSLGLNLRSITEALFSEARRRKCCTESCMLRLRFCTKLSPAGRRHYILDPTFSAMF